MRKKYILFICLLLVNGIFYQNQLFAQDLDKFGGNKSVHFEVKNNGFFRTHKQSGQWWLVTPENNAFLSFGLNHFHSNLWRKNYNKAYWEKEFGGKVYSSKWKDGFYNHTHHILEKIGANTLAYHNEERILHENVALLPYIKQFIPVRISMHMNARAKNYIDVFSPDFVQVCDDAAKEQVAPYVNDKMIIGFAMADIPVHTETHAKAVKRRKIPTWALVLRNLPATSDGKQEYVKTMKSLYTSIKEFNTIYDTKFSSWKVLEEAENWREQTDFDNKKEMKDNNVFNKKCMRKYYEVASTSFRKIDKNHLFLGDKLNANVKDIKELELIVEAAKDYVDVILFQFYGSGEYQKKIQNCIARVSQLPIINGDGGFGAYGDINMPNPQRPAAKDQSQRATWLRNYAETAFSHPNFVGWHICGVIDSWGKNPNGKQKPGIMNPLGEFHGDVINTLSSLSSEIYKFRNKQ